MQRKSVSLTPDSVAECDCPMLEKQLFAEILWKCPRVFGIKCSCPVYAM